MKIKFRPLVASIAMVILKIFFNPIYLSGRSFQGGQAGGYAGYLWGARCVISHNILRLAKPSPFPKHFNCNISDFARIHFHPDDLNNMQGSGCYFQNFAADIYIGRGSYIAQNVGIITANHDPLALDRHLPGEDVVIGERCWIGMNAIILPGVVLGNNTVVGAGSVVTKSFIAGNCVIAGNPAKIIKRMT